MREAFAHFGTGVPTGHRELNAFNELLRNGSGGQAKLSLGHGCPSGPVGSRRRGGGTAHLPFSLYKPTRPHVRVSMRGFTAELNSHV